ncbi:hypothetical protein M0G74_02900 [Microbulbifer sp. CAU 1566]|uniref:hypothetical protein n=1 Tax=Microbulbifer sp. CAU 1566 TaxID=2933269 RepID=UPI002003CFB0|nr:hypothetical protein [Microbulbifer sp. CAU 1566]MCK7596213.1 hypothetical protein [Microbulbifer sp. CAU 1566]
MLRKLLQYRMPVAKLAAALLVMLSVPMAHATKLKTQNLTQLIQSAESIVAGTVTDVTDGLDAAGVPYTEVTIAVGSVAKGKVKEGENYTFRQFGLLKPRTSANGHQMLAIAPEGFPRWHKDEYVVAFMYKKAGRTGLQTTAGMAQGKLKMINGTLVNQFNNAGMFDGVEINQQLLSAEQQNMITAPGAVNATAFMDLVGRAVAENWIAKGEMK